MPKPDIFLLFYVRSSESRYVIQKLNAAAVAALNDPAIRKRFTDLGQVIPSADRLTSEALAVYQNVNRRPNLALTHF
jgi:hypothetical protein